MKQKIIIFILICIFSFNAFGGIPGLSIDTNSDIDDHIDIEGMYISSLDGTKINITEDYLYIPEIDHKVIISKLLHKYNIIYYRYFENGVSGHLAFIKTKLGDIVLTMLDENGGIIYFEKQSSVQTR